MHKIIYLVQRFEMDVEPDGDRCDAFAERAFEYEEDARSFCLKRDPSEKGFKYECPCGCNDIHWRLWGIEPIVYEES